MKITYDAEVDVLRIIFSNIPIEESDEEKPGIILDYEDINDTLNLTSIPGQISLADIYEKIDFSSTES